VSKKNVFFAHTDCCVAAADIFWSGDSEQVVAQLLPNMCLTEMSGAAFKEKKIVAG
jgi:hypothetical protein